MERVPMPIHVVCPECQSAYDLAEEQRGKKVRCKKCANVFLAETAAPAKPAPKEAVREVKAALPRPDRAPPKAVAPAAPRRASARDDEDDDREVRRRPAPPKKSGNLGTVLLIGGLEAWKHHYGGQELVVEQAPAAPVPVTAPLVSPPPQTTEAYVQPSPQPPVSQLAPVSRTSPPNAASTSSQPETVRSLPPVPRSPFSNRTMAGTQSVSDSRPSPVPDSHPRQSFDQGAVSPRYGSSKCIPSGCADHVLPHSVAETNDVPPEPVRRVQRKPTMTRPPSVPSFPRPMSDGVSLHSRF